MNKEIRNPGFGDLPLSIDESLLLRPLPRTVARDPTDKGEPCLAHLFTFGGRASTRMSKDQVPIRMAQLSDYHFPCQELSMNRILD